MFELHFILIDDIKGCNRHYPAGDLLNHEEMASLIFECGVVSAHCFITLEDALDWNRSQEA